MTEESVTYAYLEPPVIRRFCSTCHYWDGTMAIDGFATCYQLVYGGKWRLATLENVPPGKAGIVRTHKNFVCKYWEGEE